MPQKIRNRGNGSYELVVALGYRENGQQVVKRKTVKASSDRDAARQYTLFAAEVQSGQLTPTGKYKFDRFASEWFQRHCEKNLAPKTQRSYQTHLEKRILPAFGHMDLTQIRPLHVMQFIDDLEKGRARFDGKTKTLSGQSILYCFRVLSSMLQDAMQWQLIPSNPCQRVKPPKAERKKASILEEENITLLIQALQNEPIKFRTIILLAIDSGLRLGELLGLQWDNIDFEKGMLSVTKSVQCLKGKGVFLKDPKTASSVRSLAISASVLTQLKQYRCWQSQKKLQLGDQWHDENWLFTKWNGELMYPTTPSQWFSRFLKRHNLGTMPFHSLRHLSATLLISLGVPLKNVSSRLGHTDIRTTDMYYSHALESVDKQAADKMNGFLQQSLVKRNNP